MRLSPIIRMGVVAVFPELFMLFNDAIRLAAYLLIREILYSVILNFFVS